MLNNTITFSQWQEHSLPTLKSMPAATVKTDNVTAVAHWFWNDNRFESNFFSIEFGLRMTRLYAGCIPITFVVNKESPLVDALAKELKLTVLVDKTLTNGLKSLNFEYIVNLHKYFDTEYCLTIQNDGFPIRHGLQEFIGIADYIGAPWPANCDDWITRILLKADTRVGNGGFSLRSKKICEAASLLYRRKYKLLPFCYLTVDDFFYCRVLPSYEDKFRKQIKFADIETAAEFSVERDLCSFNKLRFPPLGFHSQTGFNALCAKGWLPVLTCNA